MSTPVSGLRADVQATLALAGLELREALAGRSVRSSIGAALFLSLLYKATPPFLGGGHAHGTSLCMIVTLLLTGLAAGSRSRLRRRGARPSDRRPGGSLTAAQLLTGKMLAALLVCAGAATAVLMLNATMVVHWPAALLSLLAGAFLFVTLGLLFGTMFEKTSRLPVGTCAGFLLLVPPVVLPPATAPLTGPFRLLALVPTVGLAKLFRAAFASEALLPSAGLELAYVVGIGVLALAAAARAVGRCSR